MNLGRTVNILLFYNMLSSSSKPTPEVVAEYTRKVDFLKGLLEAEKLVSGSIFKMFFHFSHITGCFIIAFII